jgi:cytochrome c
MRAVLGAAVLGIVLVLGACSPGGQKAEAPPPVESVAATTPASAAPAEPATPAVTVALDVKDASGASLSGDPAKGKKIFLQCATCHSPDKGVNIVGPSLYGVIGRHSGTIPGFRYSEANRNSGITWTEQELFNYLENPQKRIPGTLMTFLGLKNSQQRADVIAFLKVNAEPK